LIPQVRNAHPVGEKNSRGNSLTKAATWQGLHADELADAALVAPFGKTARGVHGRRCTCSLTATAPLNLHVPPQHDNILSIRHSIEHHWAKQFG
jgi:hypothetical protein